MIPLFDAVTHAATKADFVKIRNAMKASHFNWACMIGLAGKNGYEHGTFIKECRKHACFIPIAGVDPRKSKSALSKELLEIKRLGFKGIKIHPRNSQIDWTHAQLPGLLQAAADHGLVVMLCTYCHTHLGAYPQQDPFFDLVRLLKKAKDAKIILVHGGDVRLLQYAELVRHNPNLLLDLSLTMMKYEKSSIDLDIKFLFNSFDRRICVGTDYPDYSYKDLRRRFDLFSKGISVEKKENIGFRNLTRFFEMKKY